MILGLLSSGMETWNLSRKRDEEQKQCRESRAQKWRGVSPSYDTDVPCAFYHRDYVTLSPCLFFFFFGCSHSRIPVITLGKVLNSFTSPNPPEETKRTSPHPLLIPSWGPWWVFSLGAWFLFFSPIVAQKLSAPHPVAYCRL